MLRVKGSVMGPHDLGVCGSSFLQLSTIVEGHKDIRSLTCRNLPRHALLGALPGSMCHEFCIHRSCDSLCSLTSV